MTLTPPKTLLSQLFLQEKGGEDRLVQPESVATLMDLGITSKIPRMYIREKDGNQVVRVGRLFMRCLSARSVSLEFAQKAPLPTCARRAMSRPL